MEWDSNAHEPSKQIVLKSLQKRFDSLKEFLLEADPNCSNEQRHLDADTPERTYWHYGYAMAMRDVIRLIVGRESTTPEH